MSEWKPSVKALESVGTRETLTEPKRVASAKRIARMRIMIDDEPSPPVGHGVLCAFADCLAFPLAHSRHDVLHKAAAAELGCCSALLVAATDTVNRRHPYLKLMMPASSLANVRLERAGKRRSSCLASPGSSG
jgi:hypothetical protein